MATFLNDIQLYFHNQRFHLIVTLRMKTVSLIIFLALAATSFAQQKTVIDRTRTPVRATVPGTTLKEAVLSPVVTKDIEFANWNFERALTGWTKVGTAFDNQPTYGENIATQRILYNMEYNNGGVGGDYWKDQGYNPGFQGNYWIGTYENNPDGRKFLQTQGDGAIGVLTSEEFVITTTFCYFLIGGGADAQRLYVELQTKQPDGSWKTEATRSSPRNSEQLCRVQIPLQGLQGKLAHINIVDNSAGNWGHINVDHFRFTNEVLPGINLTDASTGISYEVDVDVPVWGFADTHAHPANELGFGKKLIIGKANAPLSETYSNDLCHKNHTTAGLGLLNTPFIGGADVHKYMNGWPDFIDFPKFDSKTHNQQNVEFLKRAWAGGLRLYCALAINNMFLPAITLGPGNDGSPYDDESTIMNQIQEIKNMALTQSSWMEIAYTPKDARRIIMQGKLAIVLGVEMDNFGNFKTSTYNWNDNVNPANAKLVTLNETNADELLENKLNQYYNLGIRQVTPIHYLSGLFGGAAIFRAEIAMIQFAFNNNVSVVSGVGKKIPYSLQDDYSFKMILAGEDKASFLTKINGLGALGNINALGMTSVGTKLVNKFMDKGFIIDSEHMGYETKDMLFAIAAQRDYPIISSHTDPASLNFNWMKDPVSFSGSPEFRMENFGTTNIRNLATEFNMADAHYEKIRNSGGTVGVFMLPYYKKSYGGIANDCAGSSKTWAQMYLYSAERMNGKGVALASDRGMTDFIAPRFGPHAGYTLKDEELLSVKKDLRAAQRYAQRNGVRYDRPMTSFHLSWYHQPEEQGIDEYENDAWAAFSANEVNLPAHLVPGSFYVLHADRIRNFVKGLRAIDENSVMVPGVLTGDAPFEQAVMYCLKNNKTPYQYSKYAGTYSQEDQRNFNRIFHAVQPAWEAMNSKYGNNQPLRRLKSGNRDWDFNTDGMAHYGLMPDFLQDLRNIGLTPAQLRYLFRSAEDYIQMWEKAEKASR
jgi:microsomal dipeptidase-like Zn-dependent dipeptidase